MKKSILFLSLFVAFLVTQCNDSALKPNEVSKQPTLTIEEQKRLILLDTNYLYPIDDAKKEAILI